MKKKQHSFCQIMRRKFVVTKELYSGKLIDEKWVEEKCGTPLFRDDHKKWGVCNSCLSGWTHKENYMLDTNANKKLLAEAKDI